MAAFAMALEPGALVCRSCSGFGERAQPEPDGRVLPWSRSAICECEGTGRASCAACSERPGVGYDARGEWACQPCAALVASGCVVVGYLAQSESCTAASAVTRGGEAAYGGASGILHEALR